MNPRLRDGLTVVVGFAIVGLTLSVIGYVVTYARVNEPSTFRSFTVSASGDAVSVPDVAEFTFSVITEGGKDVAALQTKNTESVNKAIAYLKGEGVKEADIQTSGYYVSPRYEYFPCVGSGPCRPAEIVGYSVNQSVTVKVRDFSKAGALLSGTVQNGANSVSGLQFTIDDPTSVENEARAEAFAKAKEKAKGIADAGDFRLGRLLSVSEGTSGVPPVMPFDAYGGRGGGLEETKAVPAPVVEPGSQEVTVQVTLQYEIR